MHVFLPEEKIRLVKLILEERRSINSVSQEENVSYTALKGWVRNYESIGIEAFYRKGCAKPNFFAFFVDRKGTQL